MGRVVFGVCGVWCGVVFGVCGVECGVWGVGWGVWRVACGVWRVAGVMRGVGCVDQVQGAGDRVEALSLAESSVAIHVSPAGQLCSTCRNVPQMLTEPGSDFTWKTSEEKICALKHRGCTCSRVPPRD